VGLQQRLHFFQHHCYITARVPRTNCPDHGVKRVLVPWAREGSGFTLLFEQAALMLAREMPVRAAAREMAIWNFAREPRAFELPPPLEAHVSLPATSFQASFV
jgi:hypothetical protein